LALGANAKASAVAPSIEARAPEMIKIFRPWVPALAERATPADDVAFSRDATWRRPNDL
jgi:hypothetical protein